MSKAAELAALIGSGQAQGDRNLIINGAMQVAQRGTQTDQTSAYTACDRFEFTETGATVVTTSQDTTVPSGQGFTSSLKIDVTTADSSLASGDFVVLSQTIEAQNLQQLKYGTSSAENVTLSFWVRSPKTGTHIIELRHHDASLYNSQTYTISSADTWQYVTVTYSGYTATAINNDNGKGFLVDWILAAGSDFTSGTLSSDTWHSTQANRAVGQVNCVDNTANNFFLTGVQLEVGDVATAFEHEDFGTTLVKCQRYYSQYDATNGGWVASGFFYNTTAVEASVRYPQTMRAAATISTSGTLSDLVIQRAGTSNASTSSISSVNASTVAYKLMPVAGSSSTAGYGTNIYAQSTVILTHDAEL